MRGAGEDGLAVGVRQTARVRPRGQSPVAPRSRFGRDAALGSVVYSVWREGERLSMILAQNFRLRRPRPSGFASECGDADAPGRRPRRDARTARPIAIRLSRESRDLADGVALCLPNTPAAGPHHPPRSLSPAFTRPHPGRMPTGSVSSVRRCAHQPSQRARRRRRRPQRKPTQAGSRRFITGRP